MIIIEGWIRMSIADIARVKDGAVAMVAATRAEDGCEEFAFSQDLADQELFRIIERWRDEAALAAHMGSPHMADFQAAMGTVSPGGASVNLYTGDFVRSLIDGQ